MNNRENVAKEPDWSGFTLPQLEGFLVKVNTEIGKKKDEMRLELRQQIEDLLEGAGMTLEEVVGPRQTKTASGKKGKKTTRPATVKYTNPETGDTWTGRGRKPGWLIEQLEAGKELTDFEV